MIRLFQTERNDAKHLTSLTTLQMFMITCKSTSVTLMIYINAGLPLRRSDYSKGAREQHQCYFCDWREGEYDNEVELLRCIGETSTRQHP